MTEKERKNKLKIIKVMDRKSFVSLALLLTLIHLNSFATTCGQDEMESFRHRHFTNHEGIYKHCSIAVSADLKNQTVGDGFRVTCAPQEKTKIDKAQKTAISFMRGFLDNLDTFFFMNPNPVYNQTTKDFIFLYWYPMDFGAAAVVSSKTGLVTFAQREVWPGRTTEYFPKWSDKKSMGLSCVNSITSGVKPMVLPYELSGTQEEVESSNPKVDAVWEQIWNSYIGQSLVAQKIKINEVLYWKGTIFMGVTLN